METNSGSPCDYLFDCLLGDAEPAVRKAFVRHLPECPSCKKQWNEMIDVWNSLPDMVESTEPPPGLKDEVMRTIFGVERTVRYVQPTTEEIHAEPLPSRMASSADKRRSSHRFRWKTACSITVAAMFLAAAVWYFGYRSDDTFVVNAVEGPLYVEQTYLLNSADQSTEAQGTGYIVCQGKNKRLVLNTSGLATTTNEEAYQVWLIQDGKRQNAGTFWVDVKGNGVLVYDLQPSNAQFDQIGVTLEPDSHGSQPRGKKVLGN